MDALTPIEQEAQSKTSGGLQYIYGTSFLYNVDKKWEFLDFIVANEGDVIGTMNYLKTQEPELYNYRIQKNGYDETNKKMLISMKSSLSQIVRPIRKRYMEELTAQKGILKEHWLAVRAGMSVVDYYRAMAFESIDRIEKMKEIGKSLPGVYPERRILDEMRVLSDTLWKIYTIEKEQAQGLVGNSATHNTYNFNMTKNETVIIMSTLLGKLGISEDEVKKQYAILEETQNLAVEEIVAGML